MFRSGTNINYSPTIIFVFEAIMRMESVNNVIAGEFLNILLYGTFSNVTWRIKVINAFQLNSFLENWGMVRFVTCLKSDLEPCYRNS